MGAPWRNAGYARRVLVASCLRGEEEDDFGMTTRKREKMSDLGQPVDPMAPRTTWQSVWQQIRDMRLEVRQCKRSMVEAAEPQIITESSTYHKFIDCRNAVCVRGGVDIADVIGDAVIKRKTSIEARTHCCGHEGSPKGKQVYGPCLREFHLRGTIAYKD